MRGSSRTSGFCAKRGSSTVSSITKTSSLLMAWPQNDRSRELSPICRPCFDLNHWRSPSTNEMPANGAPKARSAMRAIRSEEHTSELQSRRDLVCRLLLEKKKKKNKKQKK